MFKGQRKGPAGPFSASEKSNDYSNVQSPIPAGRQLGIAWTGERPGPSGIGIPLATLPFTICFHHMQMRLSSLVRILKECPLPGVADRAQKANSGP